MTLLEVYIQKNTDGDWFNRHSSLGKGSAGRMFEYTNTNFRKQDAFTSQFSNFLDVENLSREKWPRQENHGQKVHKHMVVNMIQSKLFKKSVDGLYSKTAKGRLYSDFINSKFKGDERWLINYLFLSNGYYFNRKNYIIYRVKDDLLTYLLSVDGITEDLLIKYSVGLLKTESLKEALRNPFFFIHSFYDDSDFIINYLRSPDLEKEELATYIENNHKSENYVCCISKKYQAGGNFNHGMLIDESRVFLLTLLFIKTKEVNLGNIQGIFIKNFSQNISSINEKLVYDYLRDNNNVFEPIFTDILELEEVEIAISDTQIESPQEYKEEYDKPEEFIDETNEAGKLRIKSIYNLRKKQARIQSNYSCALEIINNCRPVYFTAKVSGKNYLELHHFIPREFRNDFPYSIEVLANYITLCPRCHRQIHLAVDRERKHLINSLYDERQERLKIVGLGIDLSGIYSYYKIEV